MNTVPEFTTCCFTKTEDFWLLFFFLNKYTDHFKEKYDEGFEMLREEALGDFMGVLRREGVSSGSKLFRAL